MERVPCENCGNLVVRTSKLCPICRTDKPNSLRNGCSIIFLAILGLVFITSNGKSDKNEAVPKLAAFVAEQTESDKDKSVSLEEYETQPPILYNEEQSVDAPKRPVDEEIVVNEVEVDENLASQVETNAIGEALETGSNQNWEAGGISGSIFVTTTSIEAQNNCKTYRTRRGTKESASATLCKNQYGVWANPG